MIDFLIRSENGWALQHMKAALVLLLGLLMLLVGPKNVFEAPHRSIKIPIWIFLTLTLIWTVGSTIWLTYDEKAGWTDKITIITLSVTCGITFFATKKYKPIIYGTMEILAGAFGMGVITFINWDQPTLVLLFGAASSIYIVVRGITNINDALVRQDEEPKVVMNTNSDDDGLEPWEFPPEKEEGHSDSGR